MAEKRNSAVWMITGVFVVVGGLLYLFAAGLGFLGGKQVQSRFVPTQFYDREAPHFSLQRLHQMQNTVSTEDFKGRVWMLNVWASWCVACREEHPVLLEMSRSDEVPLYGLNYKDNPSDARGYLTQHGNPYKISLVDYEGKTGIDYGVYGVPESFIIDKQGVIRYKVTGPLSTGELYKCVLPIYRELSSTDVPNMQKLEELRKKCK